MEVLFIYFFNVISLHLTVGNAVNLVDIWGPDLYIVNGFDKFYISLIWANIPFRKLVLGPKGRRCKANTTGERTSSLPQPFPYFFTVSPVLSLIHKRQAEGCQHPAVEEVTRGSLRELCDFALKELRLKSPW